MKKNLLPQVLLNYFLLPLLFILSLEVSAQQLRFQSCTNCPNNLNNEYAGSMSVPEGGFQYANTIQTMTSSDVASDFGRRNSNSRWHMGVDVSPQAGNTDIGDRIYPIETGTIVMLIGTGYKVLAIRGEHRYGYGHIFFDGTPDATTGMRSGDFILKTMDAPNELQYAIIYAPNGGTPTAFGREIGTVTCPGINRGRPIEVTNQVTDLNTPIAPIGNSGGDFAAHIHLYNFYANPRPNDVNSSYTREGGFNTTRFRNPKNPLEFLPHDQPVYTVAINGRNLIYPGNHKSSFRVRCSMNGVTAGQTYANAVMNLDNVELYMRKDEAVKKEYALIKGAVVESRISNGARLNSDRYPSIGFPGHNTGANAIDIARGVRGNIDEGIGSYTRTGVSASAYTNNPWDEYYFSDFPTRIHKDDNFGGAQARFASVNEEARYEDGKYQLYAKATTVRDVEYESSKTNPTSIIIDNFRPYVAKVIVSSNFDIIYESDWTWDATSNSLKRTTKNNRVATSTEPLQLTIITSESMKSLKVAIPSLGISAVTGSRIADKMWVFGISAQSVKGAHVLSIEGTDEADNALQTTPATIPLRQSATAWTPAPSPGMDRNHFFSIGEGCTNNGTNQVAWGANLRTAASCLSVDFKADYVSPSVGEPVSFTNMSSGGDGSNLVYAWHFGAGASPQTSNLAHPAGITYASDGYKTVRLEVCDGAGCVVNTKTAYINVNSASEVAPLRVNFTASKQNAKIGDAIRFTSGVTGGYGSLTYYWDLGADALPASSNEANPTVSYRTAGNKTVSLRVSDRNGSVVEIKNSYVYIFSINTAPLEANFAGCSSRAQVDGLITFSDLSFGGNGAPYDSYSWDFGDGTTSSARNPNHQYRAMGQYTVSLTVCDATGCHTKVSAGCVNVNIGSGPLNPDFLINGQSIETGNVPIVVGLNTPVHFTNTTTSPFQTTFNYLWKFDALSGSDQAYSVPGQATTEGPHRVYYQAPGFYNVSLQAYNNDGTLYRIKTKQRVIQVRTGLGSGGCYANIGQVSLTTSCWNKQGPFPTFVVPVQSDCPIAEIYISGEDGEQIKDGVLSFSNRSTPPSFPYTQTYKIYVYQFDGVRKNLLTQKEVTFTLYTTEQADAGPDVSLCPGTDTQLGSDGKTGLTYTWSASPASALAYLSETHVASPLFRALEPGTFTYTLRVQHATNGCATSDQVRVVVDKPLVVNDMSYHVFAGDAITLEVPVSGGDDRYTYAWEPADYLDDASKAAPVMTAPPTAGLVSYELLVTDGMGCTTQSQVTVHISTTIPSSLVATTISPSQIQLQWRDNSTDETAFVIERSTESKGTFVPVATLPANATRYEDACLGVQRVYYYRMYAVNAGGRSPYSNEANAKTLPGITKEWDKRFGGSENDFITKVIPTADGGYLLGGYSFGYPDGTPIKSRIFLTYDFLVVKVDANGAKQWEKRLGDISGNDYLNGLQQTSDGGYLLGGFTESNDNGIVPRRPRGNSDILVIKIDAQGNKQWDRRYGTEHYDVLNALLVTADGGFIMGGNLIIKADKNGNQQWERRYAFTDKSSGPPSVGPFAQSLVYRVNSEIIEIKQTQEGGYIWGGWGPGLGLTKLDANGNTEWTKGDVSIRSFDKTSDGGYISVVETSTLRGFDILVTKVDGAGNEQWRKEYGGPSHDIEPRVISTADGGYLFGATSANSSPAGGDKSEPNPGHFATWILKTDAEGNKQWDKTYGGPYTSGIGQWDGFLRSISQARDGGYVLGGILASSQGADASEPPIGGTDFWLLKTSSEPPIAPGCPGHVPLSNVALTSPVGGAVNVPVDVPLSCNGVTNATSYTFEANPDINFNPATAIIRTGSGPSVWFYGLQYNTTYYVRVKTDLPPATWGVVKSFTTAQPVNPVLTSHPDGAVNVPVDVPLSCNTITNATNYIFEANPDINFNPATAIVRTTSYGAVWFYGLQYNTTYYVRVKTNLPAPATWGVVKSFTTPQPANPALTSPLDGAVNVPVDVPLSCNTITNATNYIFEANPDINFNPATAILKTIPVTEGTAVWFYGLQYNTTYYIRVKTNLPAPATWGAVKSFTTTQPANPVLTSHPDGAVNVPVDVPLYCDRITNATSYTFEANPDINFNPATAILKTIPVTEGTAVWFYGLQYNTTYYIRVKTNLPAPATWGVVKSFTTAQPANPVLTSHPDGAVNVPVDIVLICNRITNATSYTFEANPDINFNPATTIVKTIPVTEGTAVWFYGLQYNTTYYVRVKTDLPAPATWGVVKSFTTQMALNGRISVSEPTSAIRAVVSPNPFSEEVRVRIESNKDEPIQLTISDMQGRILYESGDHMTNQINSLGGRLSNGVYLLHVRYQNQSKVFKLIKSQ